MAAINLQNQPSKPGLLSVTYLEKGVTSYILT